MHYECTERLVRLADTARYGAWGNRNDSSHEYGYTRIILSGLREALRVAKTPGGQPPCAESPWH